MPTRPLHTLGVEVVTALSIEGVIEEGGEVPIPPLQGPPLLILDRHPSNLCWVTIPLLIHNRDLGVLTTPNIPQPPWMHLQEVEVEAEGEEAEGEVRIGVKCPSYELEWKL
jgi:hypothetical protein